MVSILNARTRYQPWLVIASRASCVIGSLTHPEIRQALGKRWTAYRRCDHALSLMMTVNSDEH